MRPLRHVRCHHSFLSVHFCIDAIGATTQYYFLSYESIELRHWLPSTTILLLVRGGSDEGKVICDGDTFVIEEEGAAFIFKLTTIDTVPANIRNRG